MGCGLCGEAITSLIAGFLFLFSFVFSMLTHLLLASVVWIKEKIENRD